MSRSRSRLAADWFAKLRENLTTGAVEHEEIASVSDTVATTVASDIASVQAEIAAVQNTVSTSVASDIAALSNTLASNMESVQIQLAGMGGFNTQNWEIKEIDNALNFRHNAKTKAILASSGQFTIDNAFVPFGISVFELSITSHQTNLDARSYLLANGWNGTDKAILTIDSGIYISSNSTSVQALLVSGAFPSGMQLINNGYIVGMGGNGGAHNAGGGAAGGPALRAESPLAVTNAGVIAGGGGGGGAGQYVPGGIGGGGGGGRSSLAANSSGGYINGGTGTVNGQGGGGGGSGRQYIDYQGWHYPGSGGAGGGWGANGAGGGGSRVGGGGGGGAGGAAVIGSSIISWAQTGTRYGGINA